MSQSTKVIPFSGITRLDLDPDPILEGAKGRLEEVIILGFDNDGGEYYASSYADGGSVLWLLRRAETRLLCQTDELE